MSIASEIERISANVQNTIDTISSTGVTVPEGANSDDLPSLALALSNTKQDKLTGAEGQIVGFDESGNAVAQEAPSGLPTGGTDGQILTKTADGVAWEDAPEGGVTSFNNRTGSITPQAGDYTAEMVGADPAGSASQALMDAKSYTDSLVGDIASVLDVINGEVI